jgi:hypothetical protein
MSYLTLFDLFQQLQTSRRFFKIASNHDLFKREYLRLWLGLNSSKTSSSADWKSLCYAGLALKDGWQNMPDSLFTRAELHLLYEELIESLKSPPLVFPAFRREIFAMSTLAQDFLANPEDQFIDDEEVGFLSDGIRSYLLDHQEYFFHSTSVEKIVAVRWNIKKRCERLSIASNSTDCSESNENFLCRFFKNIKKGIKGYCRGVSLLIQESEEPVRVYVDCWESYSNSTRRINAIFGPVIEIFNDFYDARYDKRSCPRVSFFKVMNRIWQQIVFEENKDLLFWKGSQEIQEILQGADPFFSQLKRFVEAVLDLSLNELNVFFKYHSRVFIDGPYSVLESFFVEHFGKLGGQVSENILEGIFIPVTIKKIQKALEMTEKQSDLMDLEIIEKTENDEMIEFSAKNHGIPFDYTDKELEIFSQSKKEVLKDVIYNLEPCKNVYF